MQSVYINDLVIGEGRPKICVPVVGENVEAILAEAEGVRELNADLVEWRMDWFEDVFDADALEEMIQALRMILGDMPLLATFRTIQEGGQRAAAPEQYYEVYRTICENGWADAIDLEVFMDEVVNQKLITLAHEHQLTVIGSNHDFVKTPDKAEIERRLIKMDEMGMDILKIAVMPQSKADVLELLSATEEMGRLYTEKPLVTMSMGSLGLISRLTGEVFGSAITFGSGAKASAPGQMPAEELKTVLAYIHEHLV